MTTLINADTVLGGAIVTGDASGQLGLQAAGTTLMELSGSVVTVSGDASFEKSIVENVYTLSGTEIDPSNGTIQTKVLSAPVTFTESFSSGESVVLMIENGATHSILWPTVTWVTSAGNAAPTPTEKDTFVFWKISTTLYGAYVGSYV
jgi:hypothetical protein